MNQYIVFDLDGTISDPGLGITRCMNYALSVHGHNKVDENVIRRFIGPPLELTFKELVPNKDETGILELVATYRERYAEKGFAENTIYPGIIAAIKVLKENGLKLGVCTSKREDFARRILSLFNIADYFDFVSGGDVGISKSSQLRDLLREKVIDHSSIMIGDRAIDITSAKENGLKAIGVLWGFGEYDELASAHPKAIIKSTSELPTIINKFKYVAQ